MLHIELSPKQKSSLIIIPRFAYLPSNCLDPVHTLRQPFDHLHFLVLAENNLNLERVHYHLDRKFLQTKNMK